MVSKAELYGRTVSEQRTAKARYESSPEQRAKRAVQVAEVRTEEAKVARAKALQKRIAKLKETYTETITDGTATYTAPKETYISWKHGKNDYGTATYSPHKLTFKDGVLVSEITYSVHNVSGGKSVSPHVQTTYHNGERTEKWYKSGTWYKTHKYTASGELKGADYGEPKAKGKPRDYTEQDFYQKFNPEQKKAYEKSQMKKGIYTPEQLKKAKVLTHEAQIAEFGKVITETISRPKEISTISMQEGAYTVLGKDLQRKLDRANFFKPKQPINIKSINTSVTNIFS